MLSYNNEIELTAIVNLVYLSARDRYRVEREDKQYAMRFMGKLGEQAGYSGRILAVGISYGRREKKHFCKVEEL